MRDLWIIIFICLAININAQDDKKSDEKSSQEAIADLRAGLMEMEKFQVLEKYEREIATYRQSKKMKSKFMMVAMKAEQTKYPQAKKRLPVINQILRIHSSFYDNKVPKGKRIAVANSLRDKFIVDKRLDKETILRLSKLLPRFLDPYLKLTHKDKDFPHLIQGATYTHAKILAGMGGGRQQALKIIDKGGEDRWAEIVYKKLSKGHWTLTQDEKMELIAFKKGMNTAEAKKFAVQKRASNKHCENYTGTTVTCEGKLFVLSDQKRKVSSHKKSAPQIKKTYTDEEFKQAQKALDFVNSKVIE